MQTIGVAGAPVARQGSSSESGTSWGAILAGAVAAAALSLALTMLGAGLGLATTSPWSDHGMDASTAGIAAIAWVFATQILASALGGYLAGRLRMKWPDTQTDEVFFRDTAHGLLTWAVASLLAAALLGTALANALNSGVQAGATLAASPAGVAAQALGVAATERGAATAGAAPEATAGALGGTTMGATPDSSAAGSGAASTGAASSGGTGSGNVGVGYFIDSLFRGDQPAAGTPEELKAAAAEATTILAYSLHSGQLRPDDKTRLGQLIARHTGLNQADAERRASEVYYRVGTELANAQAAAQGAVDKARKSAVHLSLWLFVALLCGAFSASFTATIGGRQRDTWGG